MTVQPLQSTPESTLSLRKSQAGSSSPSDPIGTPPPPPAGGADATPTTPRETSTAVDGKTYRAAAVTAINGDKVVAEDDLNLRGGALKCARTEGPNQTASVQQSNSLSDGAAFDTNRATVTAATNNSAGGIEIPEKNLLLLPSTTSIDAPPKHYSLALIGSPFTPTTPPRNHLKSHREPLLPIPPHAFLSTVLRTPASTTTPHPVYQLTILTTLQWKRCWFEKILLPETRYANTEVHYIDISQGTLSDNIALVLQSLLLRPSAACFACIDYAMLVYAAAVEQLKMHPVAKLAKNLHSSNAPPTPLGSSFHAFWLASHKLACRHLVKGCDDVTHAPVLSTDRTLPDLCKPGFFKPLAEECSRGVFKYPASQNTQNPLFGQNCEFLSDPVLFEIASGYEELKPYLESGIVGIVEEFIEPETRLIVHIDGCIFHGEIHHYCISDNVYCKDAPEVYDCLVMPTQRLTEEEMVLCWKRYDTIAADLIRRGVSNQFLGVEVFVIREHSSGAVDDQKLTTTAVKTVEVNCRTSCSDMPIFSRLCRNGAGCMFSAALDMLFDKAPEVGSGFGTVKGARNVSSTGGEVGVCSYCELVPACPEIVESEAGDAIYYGVEGCPAQVYVVGSMGEAAARFRCEEFRLELCAKYADVSCAADGIQ